MKQNQTRILRILLLIFSLVALCCMIKTLLSDTENKTNSVLLYISLGIVAICSAAYSYYKSNAQ